MLPGECLNLRYSQGLQISVVFGNLFPSLLYKAKSRGLGEETAASKILTHGNAAPKMLKIGQDDLMGHCLSGKLARAGWNGSSLNSGGKYCSRDHGPATAHPCLDW